MKLKKNDQVLIMSGKDRGKKGKILQVFPKEHRILVEGINLRKKHQKPKKSGEKGQIISMPGHISASAAKLICPKCGKPTRVGHQILKENKIRICKKCNQEV
ncbi:MAG: 50S ribosomal protein L24 [Candidatus Nealsonbacteria bacterium RBG_13_42_11]|uniref:Large ribosomal subunit protein uL24 n=1 Tax=Candidatus Nealsonbacteria bacterium RBG_13_42_11 TaxID=1801663 RepID=A0A1G2DZ05_9BACT|nr:MAG: 50S ribosomal protein L24 [Candidatus Nealsonbacteria bacterium RBG_13_42_11]